MTLSTPQRVASFFAEVGMPVDDLHDLPTSTKRFPDGAQYRIEIPSVEGPACVEALIDEAARLSVPVHRMSQGTGVFFQTDAELDAMAELAREAKLEMSLFARPNASWGLSAIARVHAGFAAAAHGQHQLVTGIADCIRAADHGFRSVLIGDIGTLSVFGLARGALIPVDMQAKTSVMLPAANAAAAQVLDRLGASTINIPTDLTLPQIAAIRAVIDIPLDVYVEAPDNIGGFVRYAEIPELIRVAAPVYLKFGLRNAPDIYPSGTHLQPTAVALTRERVRRARLGVELLEREAPELEISKLGAPNLAIPVPAS